MPEPTPGRIVVCAALPFGPPRPDDGQVDCARCGTRCWVSQPSLLIAGATYVCNPCGLDIAGEIHARGDDAAFAFAPGAGRHDPALRAEIEDLGVRDLTPQDSAALADPSPEDPR